jgi:hypothetical protein
VSALMATTTATYSVRPWARIDLDRETDGATLDALLTALERDDRALGPVAGYDVDEHTLDAIFQVVVHEGLLNSLDSATIMARHVFDDALKASGLEAHTSGISIVEGDDPDQLP